MKIRFRRHGGFAPMPITCDIDSAELEPERAAHLQQLINSSGIMQSTSATVPAARDVRYYLIDIETDTESKSLKFDEISVPATIRPLIDHLVSCSTSAFEDDD